MARTRPADPVAVPASLAPLIAGGRWTRDLVGEAGAAVHRIDMPDGGALYLKHGEGEVAQDIWDEAVRLRWLAGRLPVPAVRHFVAEESQSWLLMTALPGCTAYQLLEDDPASAPVLVDALAAFLRRLHALPVQTCPFNADHQLRLAAARARMDAGLVDTDDFDEEREGWSAEQLWAELQSLLPFTPDTVVTHGDFSLDNILIEKGAVTGLIDTGRAGRADRYQDVAILWNCLGEFGEAAQHRLFTAYGIEPDDAKLRFHLALDECF